MYSQDQIIEFVLQLFSFLPREIFFLDGKGKCEGSIPVYWTVGTAAGLTGYRIVQVLDEGNWHNLIDGDSMFEVAKSLLFWYDCKLDLVKTYNYNLIQDLSVLDRRQETI